jgi:hypothetical protein
MEEWKMSRIVTTMLIAVLAGCRAGGSSSTPPTPVTDVKAPIAKRLPIAPVNALFNDDDFSGPLKWQPVPLPPVHGGCALWGATGRDHRGHIYMGVSIDGVVNPSAHLLELDPATNAVTDLGGAMEHLARLGLAKPGEGQNKIHTKIIQGPDGLLYFASMDETGEAEDGSKLPTFGSHLWRLEPGQRDWQHLADVPEAVIAVAPGGKFIYYLGYYGHVVYQIDPATGRIRNTMKVGSIGGHTTRNIIATVQDHVFVPRVSAAGAVLVELDEDLKDITTHPLEGYSTTPDASSHGLTGVTPMKDGSWCFVTDRGRLYRIVERATGSTLVDLGPLHPQGECYAAALFSPDGLSQVVAIGHRQPRGEPQYEVIRFHLEYKKATAVPAVIPIDGEHRALLIYGSCTRDDRGRLVVVGRWVRGMESVPAAWMISP